MIKLTINSGKNIVLLDDSDYERISKFNWYVTPSGTVYRSYHTRTQYGKKKSIKVSMANEIMQTTKVLYDHENRNSFDNQKSNLRQASYRQNRMNVSKQKNASSIHKGVSWCGRLSSWKVSIKFNGKQTHLGYFKLEIDAARAYNRKAIELFTEFAALNVDEQGRILC